MKKYKPIKFSDDFVFDDNKLNYVFKVKKRSYLWLWLLLIALFLGLCCVRCSHDITVHVVDHITQEPITPTSVTLEYTEHALCKGGRIFYSNTYSKTLETDENGDVVFEDMPCSVFSYIFYAFSDVCLTAENDCNFLKDALSTCMFHYTWNTTLKLQPKTEDVQVLVTDKETDEPLAGAIVHYNFSLSGQTVADSVKTDAAGKTTIIGAPRCGNVHMERVSCYGYEDTTHIDLPVLDAIEDPANAVVELVPVKQSFTYFVKNKFTKQPVPDATVEVILTSSNGSVKRGESTTNVDGKGCGVYNDAFILADLVLKASKMHYKPGQFDKKVSVKEFAELPDSSRVIYLEPEPYMEEFQNVDSITGSPIVGVQNAIKVSGQNGKTSDYVKPSNRNGVFYVKAMEGDHIVIDSKCDPQYEPKHTDIASFKEGEKIPMKPRITDLQFRTLVAGTQDLLPNCTLMIVDEEGNNYKPDLSGSGEFSVIGLPVSAILSIIAEKDGFEPNSTSVERVAVSYLITASQSRRDIPLEKEMLPCDGGSIVPKNGQEMVHEQTYNMGQQKGRASVWTDFKGYPDFLTIYDGPNTSYPILVNRKEIPSIDLVEFNFTNGAITVVVETAKDNPNSNWEYRVNCPN